jgi:hypothetical protein
MQLVALCMKHNLIATEFDVGELFRQLTWHSSNAGAPLCKQWDSRLWEVQQQIPKVSSTTDESTWLHVTIHLSQKYSAAECNLLVGDIIIQITCYNHLQAAIKQASVPATCMPQPRRRYGMICW